MKQHHFRLHWLHCPLCSFCEAVQHRPTEVKLVPHQIIKLVELCQGRFVVENLLSSALAEWKDLLDSTGTW